MLIRVILQTTDIKQKTYGSEKTKTKLKRHAILLICIKANYSEILKSDARIPPPPPLPRGESATDGSEPRGPRPAKTTGNPPNGTAPPHPGRRRPGGGGSSTRPRPAPRAAHAHTGSHVTRSGHSDVAEQWLLRVGRRAGPTCSWAWRAGLGDTPLRLRCPPCAACRRPGST